MIFFIVIEFICALEDLKHLRLQWLLDKSTTCSEDPTPAPPKYIPAFNISFWDFGWLESGQIIWFRCCEVSLAPPSFCLILPVKKTPYTGCCVLQYFYYFCDIYFNFDYFSWHSVILQEAYWLWFNPYLHSICRFVGKMRHNQGIGRIRSFRKRLSN